MNAIRGDAATGWLSIADEYELLLANFPNLELVPLRREVLIQAAQLRAQYGVKTPDALILSLRHTKRREPRAHK